MLIPGRFSCGFHANLSQVSQPITRKAVNLLRNEVAINQSLTKDYINDGHNKTIKKMQDVRLHLSTLISERTVLLLIVIVIAIGSQMWWNYSTTIQQHREADQKLQNDIANWLSPLEYSHKQNDMFDLRYPGTGKWLLESSRFNDWLSGSNQTLVLEGMRKPLTLSMFFMSIDNHLTALYSWCGEKCSGVSCSRTEVLT